MKSVAVIIPARYASTRFPAKPLAQIQGKPLILHVVERIRGSSASEIIVATDDKRIKDVVLASDLCQVVMTDPNLSCGTDRIAMVAKGLNADYILNVQGDQLIPGPGMIDEIISVIDGDLEIATLFTDVKSMQEISDENVVKALINRHRDIIYMSRSPIPFKRAQYQGVVNYYKQLGIYVFNRLALLEFAETLPTKIEMIEGIELLRVIENGLKLKGIYTGRPTADINVPEDVAVAENFVEQYQLKRT